MTSPQTSTSQAVDDWFADGGPSTLTRSEGSTLADILERVLDKGVVIAGDISISLVDVELLTIRLRLLIASVDKAREMGIDWWESDPWLNAASSRRHEMDAQDSGSEGGGALRSPERLERLEQAVRDLTAAVEQSQPAIAHEASGQDA